MIKSSYTVSLKRCSLLQKQIITELPKEWNVPEEVAAEKVHQLFDKSWIAGVWDNFMECLIENLRK